MDARKKKRLLKTPLPFTQYFSTRYLMLCFCCFILIIFITRGFNFGSSPFQPAPIVPKLAIFSTSISNSVQDLSTNQKVGIEDTSININDSSNNTSTISINSEDFDGFADGLFKGLSIESRVLFDDHILVILTTNKKFTHQQLGEKVDCVYYTGLDGSVEGGETIEETVSYSMLSMDEYGDGRWIVRCPIPPANYSAAVGLTGQPKNVEETGWVVEKGENKTVKLWQWVAYEAAFDGEDVAAVFVKGLQLKSAIESDPNPFTCHFRKKGDGEEKSLTTKAITAAQEVIRCPLPPELKANPWNDGEVEITIDMMSKVNGKSRRTEIKHQMVPSIAKLYRSRNNDINENGRPKYKYNLCACTMVWNQAAFIREWVMYHAWLGVERWFVYDNNSDDGLKEVIDELNDENYNMSRHAWPWVKAQEAGFSHCVLRTRDQCKWVAFFDVDEFFYFPPPKPQQNSSIIIHPGPGSLQKLVARVSYRSSVGDIRIDCHNFGPSGLKRSPSEGLISGYTCRLKSTERHKSIVRPETVDDSLLNQVHHFKLKKEFRRMNYRRALINHYKYQVWDVFKAKFNRRVSTYVADWQEKQNERSKDRVPGLGTEAIEPSNWHRRFCEVWDTRLRDFVKANLADRNTGMLPWQRKVSAH